VTVLRHGKLCAVRCVECDSRHTQHSEQYTNRTYDMLPQHCITYKDVVFFLANFNLNITLAKL